MRGKTEKEIIRSDIDEEIIHKKKSWDEVRKFRIKSSERYTCHNRKWNSLFFIMNFLAVILFIYSINFEVITISGLGISALYLSGIISVYIILLQYLISLKEYKYKSQLFQENEIEIEKLIVKLKELYRSKMNEQEKEQEFKVLQLGYNELLKHYLNHSELDRITNEKQNKDINLFRIFINFHEISKKCKESLPEEKSEEEYKEIKSEINDRKCELYENLHIFLKFHILMFYEYFFYNINLVLTLVILSIALYNLVIT